jgi:hypothetical protein
MPTPSNISAHIREIVAAFADVSIASASGKQPDSGALLAGVKELVDLVMSGTTDQERRDAIATLIGKAAEHSVATAAIASANLREKNVLITPARLIAVTNRSMTENQKEHPS